MSIGIRAYVNEDFAEISRWWRFYKELGPLPGMMVPDGTFVATFNDEPVMTLTAFTTQSLEVAYLEGFIARPSIDKSLRNPLGKALFDVVFYYLTTKGYKRAMILCQHERLARRYEELGMIRNCGGLISLTKGL